MIDQEKILQTNMRLHTRMFRDFKRPKKYGTHQSKFFPKQCKKCKKFFARSEIYPIDGGICESCYKDGNYEVNKKSKSENDGKVQGQPTP